MSAFEHAASQSRTSPPGVAEGPSRSVRGIVARIGAILRAIRRGHESRAAVRQLQSLSDWQLKDMGISRGQIWYLTHRTSASPSRDGHAED
jgi:uncharacterized protein YjiS (DUF1127 family)